MVTLGLVLWAMWLLPHRATQARELLPGALVVTIGHQLVQIAVIFYFAPKLGRSEETYGAFGTSATMLIWLYVISRLYHRRRVPECDAVAAAAQCKTDHGLLRR